MEKSKYTIDLRRASDKFISSGCQDTQFPEHTSPSSFREAKVYSHEPSCGIRRSYASMDLLTNSHPEHGQSALSLDSLEGGLSLPLDFTVDLQPRPNTPVNHWSSQSSWLTVGDLAPPTGREGRCRVWKKILGTDYRDGCRDKNNSASKTTPHEDDKNSCDPGDDEDLNDPKEYEESIWYKEEEEESVLLRPEACTKKAVEKTSNETTPKYIQKFHSFTKNVPSEITTCLYKLEEKCKEVEKQSESIKWKMELIHDSLQTIQETLQTLLKRLVEGMSNGVFEPTTIPITYHFPSPSQSCLPNSPTYLSQKFTHSLSNSEKTTSPSPAASTILAVHSNATHLSQVPLMSIHQDCMDHCAMDRQPSVTSLTEASGIGAQVPCRYCPKSTSPSTATADTPSSAQGEKKRAEALHVISELRMDIERLRVANTERQEHQETLLRVIQMDLETLLSHYQKDRQTWSNPIVKLETVRRQSRNISEMSRQAVAKLGKLRRQLDVPVEVATKVHTDSARLIPNSSQPCQRCTSKLIDGENNLK
ncbi:hypothetical protein UPYG_G00239880 [Umbra pygmaea]|uniref:Uncharacterized protein n=1 Tax=Umbra pygmaea TaxID=75934 RepID=A0ABD0X194_UMBPY